MLDASRHFLYGLAAQLMALQLAACSYDGFKESAFRRVFEPKVQAVRNCLVLRQRAAKRPVKLCVTCKALQIVEDHEVALTAVRSQIINHPNHARAFHEVTARSLGVAEYFLDGQAEGCRILTAAMLLTEFAAPFDLLLLAGNAAINKCSVYVRCAHESPSLDGFAKAD